MLSRMKLITLHDPSGMHRIRWVRNYTTLRVDHFLGQTRSIDQMCYIGSKHERDLNQTLERVREL
jgi:hypothetical protein